MHLQAAAGKSRSVTAFLGHKKVKASYKHSLFQPTRGKMASCPNDEFNPQFNTVLV
jgi:hypothetical protein